MSPQERAATERLVDLENKKLMSELQRNSLPNQSLGKDDFLKILLTQLAHQDPTAPMQDRDFIAQMAQFSSLEQMTNMAADFSKMVRLMSKSEASGALGRAVEINTDEETIQGVVQAVTRNDVPQVLVNGRYYNWEQVSAIYEKENY